MKGLERTSHFNKWLGLSSEYMNGKSLFNVLSIPEIIRKTNDATQSHEIYILLITDDKEIDCVNYSFRQWYVV